MITATNDECGTINKAYDINGLNSHSDTIPEIAKRLKARAQPWALIVDENYGEGSAREHAAMQPRFLGCAMILARGFARIHETNLKVCHSFRFGLFIFIHWDIFYCPRNKASSHYGSPIKPTTHISQQAIHFKRSAWRI